ncbi:MAG: hypothetical protein M3Z08_23905, partial [Chloroflexota bacterium]|nr:hypothetical protein [Chloroflexota bacterium]
LLARRVARPPSLVERRAAVVALSGQGREAKRVGQHDRLWVGVIHRRDAIDRVWMRWIEQEETGVHTTYVQ